MKAYCTLNKTLGLYTVGIQSSTKHYVLMVTFSKDSANRLVNIINSITGSK